MAFTCPPRLLSSGGLARFIIDQLHAGMSMDRTFINWSVTRAGTLPVPCPGSQWSQHCRFQMLPCVDCSEFKCCDANIIHVKRKEAPTLAMQLLFHPVAEVGSAVVPTADCSVLVVEWLSVPLARPWQH
jgi:hypothetical protein